MCAVAECAGGNLINRLHASTSVRNHDRARFCSELKAHTYHEYAVTVPLVSRSAVSCNGLRVCCRGVPRLLQAAICCLWLSEVPKFGLHRHKRHLSVCKRVEVTTSIAHSAATQAAVLHTCFHAAQQTHPPPHGCLLWWSQLPDGLSLIRIPHHLGQIVHKCGCRRMCITVRMHVFGPDVLRRSPGAQTSCAA